MKRVALLCLGLALGAANAAEAQLTMQMSNGWSFTFAGNVNAFIIYQQGKTCAPGGGTCATASEGQQFRHRPPAGLRRVRREGQGGEHSTSASTSASRPRSRPAVHYASFFGSQAAGAQIDMRQVYLTAGGTWGQLLMGKELGLFQRGNILNDMTLLGVGVGGGRARAPRWAASATATCIPTSGPSSPTRPRPAGRRRSRSACSRDSEPPRYDTSSSSRGSRPSSTTPARPARRPTSSSSSTARHRPPRSGRPARPRT